VATIAVIWTGELTVKLATAVPPKLTELEPEKPVPVMVTDWPPAAEAGEKDEITGAPNKVNPDKLPVPPGVVTATVPLAPVPTTAVI
jgi:hypothetical protein